MIVTSFQCLSILKNALAVFQSVNVKIVIKINIYYHFCGNVFKLLAEKIVNTLIRCQETCRPKLKISLNNLKKCHQIERFIIICGSCR